LPARILKVDDRNDIAVLKVEGDFPFLRVGQSGSVKIGAPVFTVGFPIPDIQGIAPKLTRGHISALSGLRDDPRHFQVSVPIQKGNSGGALIDENGGVVGILIQKLNPARTFQETRDLPENVNYAVKINYARSLLDLIPPLTASLRDVRPQPPVDVFESAVAATALVLVGR
jgi:hypothetical protein